MRRPLLVAGAVGLTFVAAVSYLPALRAVFHTAPLGLADWAVLVVLGAALLAAEELRKWWLRHRATHAHEKGQPS